MKRFISVLLIVTMLFSLAGCSSEVPPEKMNAEQFAEWVNTTPYEKVVDWMMGLSEEQYQQWLNGEWAKGLAEEKFEMWKTRSEKLRKQELLSTLPVFDYYPFVREELQTYVDPVTHVKPSDLELEEFESWVSKVNIVDFSHWAVTNQEWKYVAMYDESFFNDIEQFLLYHLQHFHKAFRFLPEGEIFSPPRILKYPDVDIKDVKIPSNKKPEEMNVQEFTKWLDTVPVLDVLFWAVSLSDEEYNDWVYGEWIGSLPTERINYELPAETWIRLFDYIRGTYGKYSGKEDWGNMNPRGYMTPYYSYMAYEYRKRLS